MTDKNQTITNKMEDLFLSILRGVILVVLAVSILAAIYFAISGVTDLGAKPKDYTYEKFDSKQLINDLKESLKDQPEKKPDTKPETEKKSEPQANNPLEEEITKSANLVVKYFKAYDFNINENWINQKFKPSLRTESNKLHIIYGTGDNAKLEYLKGQTQVFELVLLNPELNQLLDKKFKAQVDVEEKDKFNVVIEFFEGKVRDFYPDFHQDQIDKKKEFDTDQNAEVAMRIAGSMFKLYVAGGLFAAFLLLSLILVLVKIERNLRSTKIEEIVEA
jgi:hypothetical protein